MRSPWLAGAATAALLAAPALASAAERPSSLDPEAHPLLKSLPWLPRSVRDPKRQAQPAPLPTPAASAPSVAQPVLSPTGPGLPVAPAPGRVAAQAAPDPARRPTSLDPEAHPLLKVLPWLSKDVRRPSDSNPR